MALVTAILDPTQPALLCGPTQGALAPNGMVVMYLLMMAFHLAPWIAVGWGNPDFAPGA